MGYFSNLFETRDERRVAEVDNVEIVDAAPPKKKRGRPAGSKNKTDNDNEGYTETSQNSLTMLQSNTPYESSYESTNNALKTAVVQLDYLNNEVMEQIKYIKDSKTLKKKYDYISNLSEVSSGIISSKISALRELNSTITKCHDLELKRAKDMKISMDTKSDDERLMDMYNAYISAPMGQTYNFIPPQLELVQANPNGINRMIVDEGTMYDQYQANKTPEQNLMLLADDPNIKTVVVYDQGTGQRRFDVVDMRNGQSVPNMPLPDPAFLDDTTINLKTGTARNSNINMNYPLIVTGSDLSKF